MILLGWLNIFAARYTEEHPHIYDVTQKYGKQLIWIGVSMFIAILILVIEAEFYPAFAYIFFAIVLAACIAVPFLGREIKGSRSWFRFGDFGLQPAEFMKFATALALAKLLSQVSIQEKNDSPYTTKKGILFFLYCIFTGKITKALVMISDPIIMNTAIAGCIIGIPLIIIKFLQDETGLALVFLSFVFVLYREGLTINILLIGFAAILLFVLALVVNNLFLYIALGIITAISFMFIKRDLRNIMSTLIITLASCAMVFGTKYVYNKLDDHQKVRINVLFQLGEVNMKKEGYNINQSLIAIGSGGIAGKGYLEGTQTKFDFVPEQDTDFIFCTVGEEEGFIGCAAVLFLQLGLILRIIFLSERQRSPFSRIYGYCVASILFFHIAINIGMTIGLAPVIGIPLPFFSYGGSSLLAFTILVFIFIKLDSSKLAILR